MKQPVKKGFSLIEIMIALFVLIIGIIATITLVTESVQQTRLSRDALIAASLAQEGTELVRNVRDANASSVFFNNKFGNTPVGEIFGTPFPNGAGDCRVEPRIGSGNLDLPEFQCGSVNNNNARLRLNSISGNAIYQHSGSGAYSGYSRKIVLGNPRTSGGELKSIDVTSIVTWGNASISGMDKDDCSIDAFCVQDSTTLTTWIIRD